MSYGSLWQRWTRGVAWTWVNERYRSCLPEDLASGVMNLDARDRLHTKQGRSTARVVFHAGKWTGSDGEAPARGVSVYLKRQYRLPWTARLAATLHPAGRYSPAGAEWAHLEHGRSLGIDVPEVVAAGERIGPCGQMSAFLMVAELTGCEALHEAIPRLASRLEPSAFATLKRRVIAEMARIAATLHAARLFHKDLYLCHFFLDVERLEETGDEAPRLVLIDLHRLSSTATRAGSAWLRWKDLGQLLYSTFGVDGIDNRDRLRFWRSYRKRCPVARPAWQAWIVKYRAARYLAHNRKRR
ncbi:MAG: lipopolysaccharide kinase InaA family protein [Isosphaeraceae bacterium]